MDSVHGVHKLLEEGTVMRLLKHPLLYNTPATGKDAWDSLKNLD